LSSEVREGNGVVNGRECLIRAIDRDKATKTRVLHIAQPIAVYGRDGALQRHASGRFHAASFHAGEMRRYDAAGMVKGGLKATAS
jgi:hypothetical protein